MKINPYIDANLLERKTLPRELEVLGPNGSKKAQSTGYEYEGNKTHRKHLDESSGFIPCQTSMAILHHLHVSKCPTG